MDVLVLVVTVPLTVIFLVVVAFTTGKVLVAVTETVEYLVTVPGVLLIYFWQNADAVGLYEAGRLAAAKHLSAQVDRQTMYTRLKTASLPALHFCG